MMDKEDDNEEVEGAGGTMDFSMVPPPLPPPPPPPPPPSLPTPSGLHAVTDSIRRVVSEGQAATEGDLDEPALIFSQRRSSFDSALKWLLFNKYVPPVIQNGPQCGLVALHMAGCLVAPAGRRPDLDAIFQTAKERGYTAQGEMFSAFDMSRLAEDLYGCQVTLLQNGMLGENRSLIIEHLVRGQPVLIPYDSDSNYEPCNKRGHKAHWAVVTGALLGMDWSDVKPCFEEVTETPGLYSAESVEDIVKELSSAPGLQVRALYLLAKQGKSARHRLWDFDRVAESNGQLLEFDPRRQADGTTYVVPAVGGVRAGLCGKLLLLAPATATPAVGKS